VSDGGPGRDLFADVKLQVEFGGPVFFVLPECPEHFGKGREQGAVHGLEALVNLFQLGIFLLGDGLTGQFFNQGLQKLRVKDLGRFRKRAQRCFLKAKTFLDFFQRGGLLDSSEAGENRREKIQKYQGQILIIKELSVLMGFGVMKPVQYFEEDVQILESLDLFFPEGRFSLGAGSFLFLLGGHREQSLRRKCFSRG